MATFGPQTYKQWRRQKIDELKYRAAVAKAQATLHDRKTADILAETAARKQRLTTRQRLDELKYDAAVAKAQHALHQRRLQEEYEGKKAKISAEQKQELKKVRDRSLAYRALSTSLSAHALKLVWDFTYMTSLGRLSTDETKGLTKGDLKVVTGMEKLLEGLTSEDAIYLFEQASKLAEDFVKARIPGAHLLPKWLPFIGDPKSWIAKKAASPYVKAVKGFFTGSGLRRRKKRKISHGGGTGPGGRGRPSKKQMAARARFARAMRSRYKAKRSRR